MSKSVLESNLARAKFTLASALSLELLNCFYCDTPAKQEYALDVFLHDPKTVHWQGKHKRWIQATIDVPRCEKCYKLDQKQKLYSILLTISALAAGAVGVVIGAMNHEFYRSDYLPFIVGILGLFITLFLFGFLARASFRKQETYRLRHKPSMNYAPVKHLLSAGWKHGNG